MEEERSGFGSADESAQSYAAPATADAPVANWYRDPDGDGWRFWDGEAWTEKRSSSGPPSTGLWILCLALAALVPIVGLIVGIVLTVRGGPKASLGKVMLAFIAVVLVGIVIAASVS
jgi:hypothetical protein